MKLRFTAKDENIKPFVCLRRGQMYIKCIFVLNCLFLLIIHRVQNADINRTTQWTVNKKEYMMKSGMS
jgi:hypothetical protein